MPDVLQLPTAPKPRGAPWTPQQAREMARLGNIARWHRPKIVPQDNANNPLITANDDPSRALERVRKQIEAIDCSLDKCKDARDWDMLTRAKERLFKCWVHLAGIPGPGQRKPAPERAAPRATAMPEPTLASAAPVPVVTRSPGWEYDNQTGEQAGVRESQ